MKYVIVIVAILIIAFVIGFIFGAVVSEEDPAEREMEDRDQMEYLKEWHKRRKRS